MKIKKIEIYGYGKWIDQTFNLNEGLQLFMGDNEAGKSTLMSFIHSILFGFPTRNSTLLRYEPLESSRYGGKVVGEDPQLGEIIIERIHGKVTGDVTVTLEDGSTGSDDLLARILKGIDRDNFQNIFSFSLSDIEHVNQLDRNKLSRYLLNIGAHSTDYYLDLVDEFHKEAYDLYRPSGRIPPLNQALATIKKQEKKLKTIENRNESYLNLVNLHQQQDKEVQGLEEKLERIKAGKAKLELLEKDLHLFEEITQLQLAISESDLPPLKEDGPYLLQENINQQIEIKEELTKVSDAIENIQKKINHVEMIDKYRENQQDIKKMEEELPDKVGALEVLKRLEKDAREYRKQEKLLKNALHLNGMDSTVLPLPIEEQRKIRQLAKEYKKIKTEIIAEKEKLEALAVKIEQKNEQADYYEELMWEHDYLAQIETKLSKQPTQKEPTQEKTTNKSIIIASVIGAALILSSFFVTAVDPIFLSGLGLLLLIFSFIYSRKNQNNLSDQNYEDDGSLAILAKEYQKQLNIQADWQKSLAEIDAVQSDYQFTKNKIKEKKDVKNQYIEKWQMSLSKHQIPPVHPIETVDELLNDVNQLVQIQKEKSELETSQLKLTKRLENEFTLIEKFLPETEGLPLNEKVYHFRQYLKEINHLINSEAVKIEQLARKKQAKVELENQKEKLDLERKHLFDSVGVTSEKEYHQLYAQYEELKKKESRLQFLKENTESLDAKQEIPTANQIIKKKENLEEKLSKLNNQITNKIDERAKTKITIQNLEKDGRYSEALQEFENQKARTQSLVDEWISDRLAAAIIQSTLNQVTRDRFEEIILEINTNFNYLTNGKYDKIVFQDDELFVQDKDGRVVDVKTLSRGTAEPLYVAIRLAYIVQLQDVIHLPIIMDDPFVNFDQERRKKIHRLLKKLSGRMQIIYFTFDRSLEEYFTEEEIIDLNQEIT